MKKILFALIASAATLAGTSAYAADFGDDAGSRYKFDVPNAVSSSGNSGTKAGGKIYGGYNIDKTWAVEGGYTNFGKQDYDYTVNGAAGHVQSDAHSFYVAGNGTWPVNEQVALFGKQVKVSLEYENYGKNNVDLGRKNGAITAGVRYNF